MPSYQIMQRLSLIVLTLFPALWGIFSLLNNVSGFSGTLQYAVEPLLAMKNTYGNPAQTWRAIDSATIATIALIGITIVETLAGLFGIIAIIAMVRTLSQSSEKFEQAKAWVMASASCGVLVWGVGIMVIAGDWFLAWQAKENSLNTQLAGALYALPCFITLLAAMIHREERGE